MSVMRKIPSVKMIKPAKISTDPQGLVMPHTKANNYVVAEAVCVSRVVDIPGELPRFSVKIKQAATIGANPKVTFCIFKKPVHVIIWQTVGVRKLMMV